MAADLGIASKTRQAQSGGHGNLGSIWRKERTSASFLPRSELRLRKVLPVNAAHALVARNLDQAGLSSSSTHS